MRSIESRFSSAYECDSRDSCRKRHDKNMLARQNAEFPENNCCGCRCASDNRRKPVARIAYLVDKQDCEQSGKRKVNACKVKRNERACNGTDCASCNPVQVVKHGYCSVKRAGFCALRQRASGKKRVCFVGKRKDEIWLPFSRVLEFCDERKPVHDMADIYGKLRDGYCRKVCSRSKKTNCNVLTGSGVHRYAHNRGKPPRVSCVYEHETERNADCNVAEKDGNRNSHGCVKMDFRKHGASVPCCALIINNVEFLPNLCDI